MTLKIFLCEPGFRRCKINLKVYGISYREIKKKVQKTKITYIYLSTADRTRMILQSTKCIKCIFL